jgi:hypothetical protein
MFMDCDMLVRCDLYDVWCGDQRAAGVPLARSGNAVVLVCQHDYTPRAGLKATGAQTTYPRKNWSSFMVFANAKCRAPDAGVREHRLAGGLASASGPGRSRRRQLPLDFNWLVGEYDPNPDARVLHYTLGTPCFPAYRESDHADLWFEELARDEPAARALDPR